MIEKDKRMGVFIKELLDFDNIYKLTADFTPSMIQQENVGKAARELVKTVNSLELYPDYDLLIKQFETLQEKYPSIYGHRPRYLWAVAQTAFQLATLDLSDADFLASNAMKCQLAVLTILFDDICDMGHDTALFKKCVLALKGEIGQDETALYQIFADIWTTFQNSIKQTPNYEVVNSALEGAYQKWIDSFEYGLWLEKTSRTDETWQRHLEIIAHSSGTIYLGGLIDLAFLPNFPMDQFQNICDVFLNTQKMIQIINWLASWKREFKQRDFTSGVFSMALVNGWVNWDELQNESLENIQQKIENSPVEANFWQEWQNLRVESLQIANKIKLPELNGYVDRFFIIMFMQLASSSII